MEETVREAQRSEICDVLALWIEAGAHPTSTDDVESLERLLSCDPGAIIVIEDDGRLVGSVISVWDGWRGSIYRLAVVPSHRRRGLGQLLVEAAERRLVVLGAQRFQASVASTDDRAQVFWRSTGWEHQVGMERFVRDCD